MTSPGSSKTHCLSSFAQTHNQPVAYIREEYQEYQIFHIMPSSALTPEGRLQNIVAGCHKFHQYLLDQPGIVLTTELRVSVAQYAREALLNPVDIGVSKDACLRPGALFDMMANKTEGIKSSCFPTGSDVNVSRAIANMVQCVVNYQVRLDQKWFEKTLKGLKELNVIPESKRAYEDTLSLSLYCEVLALTVASHGLHLVLLSQDKPVPPMPNVTQPKEPTYLDVTTLLKPARTLKTDLSASGFVPVFGFSDMNHAKCRKMFTNEQMGSLRAMLSFTMPWLGLSASPFDAIAAHDISCLLTLPDMVRL